MIATDITLLRAMRDELDERFQAVSEQIAGVRLEPIDLRQSAEAIERTQGMVAGQVSLTGRLLESLSQKLEAIAQPQPIPAPTVNVPPLDLTPLAEMMERMMGTIAKQNDMITKLLTEIARKPSPVTPVPVVNIEPRGPREATIHHSDGTQSTITIE